MTLIELTVVIVIIAVLAGLIVPQLAANSGGAALRESANGLLSAARYARQYAVTRGRPCRLVIEMNENRYHLETLQDDDQSQSQERKGFQPLRSGPIKATMLINPLRFEDVLLDPRRRSAGGQDVITFEPTGEADAAAVRIGDGRRVFTLVVMPNTGRIELIGRAVNQLPNDREDLDG